MDDHGQDIDGRRRRQNQQGFTLLEMVIVTLIMGIIAGVTAPLSSAIMDAFLTGRDQASLDQRGRLAMARLSRELREATSLPSGPFSSASIQYQREGQNVTWQLSANNDLQRIPGATLIQDVAQIQFISNDDAPPVQTIQIVLTMNTAKGTPIIYRTTVMPRSPES